tara:strand:- start:202 stop:366 length:165 start_codon:yes stop_codon:yes gene_type:complete
LDPIRYGFIQTILDFIKNFIDQLPPLLQLIMGVFLAIGAFKILIAIGDHFEKRK